MSWRLYVRDSGQTLVESLELADRWWSRLRGLQFRRPLPAGSGMLLVPCPSVHTFFVRAAIDVVLLDREGRVVKVRRGVRPWRIVAPARGAYASLELPAGAAKVEPGDVVCVDDSGQAPPRSLEFLRPRPMNG